MTNAVNNICALSLLYCWLKAPFTEFIYIIKNILSNILQGLYIKFWIAKFVRIIEM